MALLGIIALVILLYARTLSYNYIIDDNVKRNGYMYEVPLAGPDVTFYYTRPSKWYRGFMIARGTVSIFTNVSAASTIFDDALRLNAATSTTRPPPHFT